jgi:hypothetical protein
MPFAEVVRDFADVPEARDAGTRTVSTNWPRGELELGSFKLPADLSAGGAFLLLDWGVTFLQCRQVLPITI